MGQHQLVKEFLKASKWRSATARPLVPRWDLAVVLDALSGPPFEPIESLELWLLTLKTLFLVAITMAKQVSDLRALSINEFGAVLAHSLDDFPGGHHYSKAGKLSPDPLHQRTLFLDGPRG